MPRPLITVKMTARQLNAVLRALEVAMDNNDDAFEGMTDRELNALDRGVAIMLTATHTS